MKVSVIMGIYNCAPYLQEALDSLYAQTFQDFEIILCEDGSSDNTYEVALENQKTHPNIVLLKNEHNMGLNKTLNNCLAVAKGEYIARMDGDDVCDPTRFEKEVRFLDEHPEYAIVSCPMIYFDENGEFGRGKGGNEPTKYDFIGHSPICHAPCMVRKTAYLAVNGYTESKYVIRHEDYDLWTKMYAKGYKAYNLDECLYSMRDDQDATKRRKMTWQEIRNTIYSIIYTCSVLKLPFRAYLFCFKPVVMLITPRFVYNYIHRKRLNV